MKFQIKTLQDKCHGDFFCLIAIRIFQTFVIWRPNNVRRFVQLSTDLKWSHFKVKKHGLIETYPHAWPSQRIIVSLFLTVQYSNFFRFCHLVLFATKSLFIRHSKKSCDSFKDGVYSAPTWDRAHYGHLIFYYNNIACFTKFVLFNLARPIRADF